MVGQEDGQYVLRRLNTQGRPVDDDPLKKFSIYTLCHSENEANRTLAFLRNELPDPQLFHRWIGSDREILTVTNYRKFHFVDLFCGIGGFRLGIERIGGRCVLSCDKDKFARQTYQHWFGDEPACDIRDYSGGYGVPEHDLLVGGFPCQPFSHAGVSKRNSLGRVHGFLDQSQGTLFFEVAKLVDAKRPKVVLLENVKNLQYHDKGRTFAVIKATLEELGYAVFHQVLDAVRYVPQHRERVFIVALRKDLYGDEPVFEFPTDQARKPQLRDVLLPPSAIPPKYTLSDKMWQFLQDYKAKHQAAGNGFGYGIATPSGISRTLSARYYKDGSEILIRQKGKNPRRLTPIEAGLLMGFPYRFLQEIPVSDTQAYKQLGNAVVPPLIESIAWKLVPFLWDREGNDG